MAKLAARTLLTLMKRSLSAERLNTMYHPENQGRVCVHTDEHALRYEKRRTFASWLLQKYRRTNYYSNEMAQFLLVPSDVKLKIVKYDQLQLQQTQFMERATDTHCPIHYEVNPFVLHAASPNHAGNGGLLLEKALLLLPRDVPLSALRRAKGAGLGATTEWIRFETTVVVGTCCSDVDDVHALPAKEQLSSFPRLVSSSPCVLSLNLLPRFWPLPTPPPVVRQTFPFERVFLL